MEMLKRSNKKKMETFQSRQNVEKKSGLAPREKERLGLSTLLKKSLVLLLTQLVLLTSLFFFFLAKKTISLDN